MGQNIMANLKYTINTFSYQKGIRSLGFSTPESVDSDSKKFAEMLEPEQAPVVEQQTIQSQPVLAPQIEIPVQQIAESEQQPILPHQILEEPKKVVSETLTTPDQITPHTFEPVEQTVDITPIVKTPVERAGTRLDEKISKTGFIQKSPYNMSDETAKRIAAAEAEKPKTRPISENDKVFPLNQAAKFTGNTKMLPPELVAKTTKDKSSINPVDVDKIKENAINMPDYPRGNIPNLSKQPTSPAASWFPQAMTRQLDMYESMKKVQQQEQNEGTSAIPTNLKI